MKSSSESRIRAAICFSQFGPYHHARVDALREQSIGLSVKAVQIAAASKTYAWNVSPESPGGLITLCAGAEEDVSFISVFFASWRFWRREEIDAAFLPSYFPASSLALLLSAKLAGVKCIMMNESHGGTERAVGLKRKIKRFLISLFDGAIVGGEPHRRYFISMGMNPGRVVTGYDAVDNDYFSKSSIEAIAAGDTQRANLGLPKRYLLSLGRMVKKKNLSKLVDAFAALKVSRASTGLKLVFVGSGDCQPELVSRCEHHQLSYSLAPKGEPSPADVLFYGFRQIDENPIFYALAEAFILPSLYEEWGLVVNEAMACRLPVIVSSTVGSAEDLVAHGVNGFQFDPNSISELAGHIEYLEDHPEEGKKMGLASFDRIQNWGCENFARRANEILAIVTR